MVVLQLSVCCLVRNNHGSTLIFCIPLSISKRYEPNKGDSGYTTYLQNPTTISKALKSVGATELIDMGKADAKQIGENSQENTILKWKEGLWIPLAKAVAAEEDESINLKEMQKGAIPIMVKADPDYTPPKEFGGRSGAIQMHLLVVAVIVALIAALLMTGVIESP